MNPSLSNITDLVIGVRPLIYLLKYSSLYEVQCYLCSHRSIPRNTLQTPDPSHYTIMDWILICDSMPYRDQLKAFCVHLTVAFNGNLFLDSGVKFLSSGQDLLSKLWTANDAAFTCRVLTTTLGRVSLQVCGQGWDFYKWGFGNIS